MLAQVVVYPLAPAYQQYGALGSGGACVLPASSLASEGDQFVGTARRASMPLDAERVGILAL